MLRPNEPAFNRPDCSVIDDLPEARIEVSF